jgi:hypothetical protein
MGLKWKFSLALVFVSAMVALGGAPAQAATFDPTLRSWTESALRVASRGPDGTEQERRPLSVYVRCFSSSREFERAYGRGARYVVAWYQSGGIINMRAGTCEQANLFVQGIILPDTAGAFHVLLHEALHRQGFRSERSTEAYAIATMRIAGQLAEYNSRYGDLPPGWQTDSRWADGAPAGNEAMRFAWQQSQRYIASSYRSSWSYVNGLSQSSTWADVV